ncbi:tetratricopeptide repeat protein [Rhizobium sp. RAF56]|uniref:tetratricopeptide repeat protein n=1 Tax=Rhizobium sp. RAF56 TaxID=3233062 RepID=UPI003F9B865B
MRPIFIALAATGVAITVVAVLTERNRIDSQIERLFPHAGEPVDHPQLMGLGRVDGPLPSQDDEAGVQKTVRTPALEANEPDVADTMQVAQATPPANPQPAAPQAVAPQPIAPQPAAPPSQASPPAANPQQPDVDESALRYFASRGDKARLQAEISRLKALYPYWTPPADPLSVPLNQDKRLEAMWQLYSEGRFAELRKAIADRQGVEPAWQPPADLIERLNVAEIRARLVNASDLKQYETVIRLGSETPSLLTCSDVDVLWRVAEAFANTDRQARARDAYLYVLKNCDGAPERLATIQKAAALLPYPVMQELLAAERPLPAGGREFDSIRDDLARRFISDATTDPNLVISPDYRNHEERLAETQGLASDALLLGWYYLRREDMATAEKWFRAARTKEDSASASQGLALVLIARDAPQEAEDVMYRWHDASKDATATYLAATANLLAIDPPVQLEPNILQRIAAVVLKEKDPSTAQQFGWYARGLNQPQTAAQWFATSLGWKPDDEPSAYGLVLSRAQLNDKAGVAELQRIWAGRSERIARLGETEPSAGGRRAPLGGANQTLPVIPPGGQVAVTPGQDVQTYARPIQPRVQAPVRGGGRAGAGCAKTIDPAKLSPAVAVPRGWCLMEVNRPVEAAAAFEVGLRSEQAQARQDAAYGLSLAYLRLGLTSQAAVAATRAPLSAERSLELQSNILSDRAANAFAAKRFRESIQFLDQLAQIRPERVDLMVMRGYAYLGLKRFADAIRIFEAAAATGNHAAITGLSDAREAQRAPPH